MPGGKGSRKDLYDLTRIRVRLGYSRPVTVTEHGFDAPARAEDIERLGEAVVINDPCVDGKDSHQQDDVAA